MQKCLTKEWLPQLQSSCGYERFTLVLETNWIRQAVYNHWTGLLEWTIYWNGILD